MMQYPWQQQDWHRLNSERTRFSHAYLLTGWAGIGKLAFAQQLAQSLLCDTPDATYFPCGQCEACRWFLAGNHPDFRLLSPSHEEGEGTSDGKVLRQLAIIKIEAVRELIEWVHLSAHRHGPRVILIEPADALNLAGANALLKILEEPPLKVIFLLVTHAPQRLLPTVRSRCCRFSLTLPSYDEALAWLKQQDVAYSEAQLAYHGGAPLFHEDPVVARLRQQFIEALLQRSLSAMLSLAEQLDKQKLPLGTALQWLQKWLFDLLAWQLAGVVRYYPSYQAALEKLSLRAPVPALLRCQQYLTELAPFAQHTLNIRLQLEAMLIEYLQAVSPMRSD